MKSRVTGMNRSGLSESRKRGLQNSPSLHKLASIQTHHSTSDSAEISASESSEMDRGPLAGL